MATGINQSRAATVRLRAGWREAQFMAGRRTNLALFVLLLAAFVTGGLAFAVGSGWNRWAVAAHGIVGLGIVVLSPWKSVIARRGLRRRRPGRAASVVLSVAVVAALLLGALHSTGVARSLGPLTAMQIHVGAALLALPFALWHVVARRVRVHHSDVSRRALLKSGAVIGGAGFLYVAVEGTLRVARLPGASRRGTGSYEQGSGDPDRMPVTQWLNDSVPEIDVGEWQLTVHADADTTTLAYDDIEGYDDRVTATLDCTGGWWARQEWTGVRLDRLLADAGLSTSGARSIAVRSATGYSRLLPLHDAPRLLLATRVAGEPLSGGHGFPARLAAPGRRGFWWVKWVVEIELSDVPWWAQSPFPLT